MQVKGWWLVCAGLRQWVAIQTSCWSTGVSGLAASVHSGAAASAGWVGLHMLCRHGPVIGVPAMQACPCTAASCYAEWHGPIQCSGTLHAGCAMSPSLACIPQAYVRTGSQLVLLDWPRRRRLYRKLSCAERVWLCGLGPRRDANRSIWSSLCFGRLISSCQVVERMPSCLSPRCEYCLEHYQVIPIWFFLELCMTPVAAVNRDLEHADLTQAVTATSCPCSTYSTRMRCL